MPGGGAGEPARGRGWGGVARRGARVVGEPDRGGAPGTYRQAAPRSPAGGNGQRWEPEVWVEEQALPASPGAEAPLRRARSGGRARRPVPADVASELSATVGPRRALRLQQRLAEATHAYEADRYPEARRILKPLAAAAPSSAAVRELHGLTLYRMGKWAEATRELEAFHQLTGSLDQHPVLADCHRALGHWRAVQDVWDELRRASPSADLVTEGRIVMAGALADRGDLPAAIRMLERAAAPRRQPRTHHVRLWYALADLYERAGEVPRARELFRRVLAHDPGFVDVAERLAALD